MDYAASILFVNSRLEESRAWQTELRQKHGEHKAPQPIAWLQHSLRCEEAVRANIIIQMQDSDEDGLRHSYARLTELMLEQGRFNEACEIAPLSQNQELIERAEAAHKALHRPDDETCSCPSRDLNTKHSNNYVNKEFWVNGALVPELTCVVCGESNIRPLRDGDVSA